MPPTRRCSECGEALGTDARQRTCSQKCRSARARRIKRNNKAKAEHGREMIRVPEALKVGEMEKTMQELAKEELRPVVREAITEDVLRAAERLVNLTPKLVDCLAEDLDSNDRILRQKAYTLLARYTLGNQSIAPQPDAPKPEPMQVVFAMPQPEVPEATVVEEQECAECHETKPVTDFVSGSQRCNDCHARVQAEVMARFGQT